MTIEQNLRIWKTDSDVLSKPGLIADLDAAAAEIKRLRYWLLKLGRDDIVNDADKFAGPEEERRRDAVEQVNDRKP